MTAPTVYAWDDAGAPSFIGTSQVDGLNYLFNIIKKCLVDGYGSQQSAGWELIGHQVGDGGSVMAKLAIGNATGSGYARFSNESNGYGNCYAFDFMTDVDSGSAGFSGANSYSESPSGALLLQPAILQRSNSKWWVVANSKTAIILLGDTSDEGKAAVMYMGDYNDVTSLAGASGGANKFIIGAAIYFGYGGGYAGGFPNSLTACHSRYHDSSIKSDSEKGKNFTFDAPLISSAVVDLCELAPVSHVFIIEPSRSGGLSASSVIGFLSAITFSRAYLSPAAITANKTGSLPTGQQIVVGSKNYLFLNNQWPVYISLHEEDWC